MAEKNIQIKDLAGNLLFPKTKGAVVLNNAGENLGAVEAGAQVNKIETVKVNGVALNIVDKAVDVNIPAAVEYTVVKADAADEGYAATYQLAKDGVAFGTKINIPKDMVVSAGELKFCEQADAPVAGLAVGDPYIELTIANNDGSKIYIPAKDLVDVYTAGDATIDITGNAIKVNVAEIKTQIQDTFYTETEVDGFIASAKTELEGKITAVAGDLATHTGDADIHVTAEQKTAWTAKQDALTADQLAAVNSGIDATAKAGYDTHLADADIHVTTADKATWNGKQDALDATQMAAVNSGIDATAKAKYDGYEALINASLTYEELA